MFWLSVPCALAVAGLCRTAVRAWMATAAVTAAVAIAAALTGAGPEPSPLLAVLVPAASTAVLLAARSRFERERDELLSAALTDPLTGLANRRSLLARAEYEIARHVREGRSFAVLMIDLDGFKGLNDRFGHAAGDELLCDVADALVAAARAQDTVARLGGDEFCVLAPETDRAGAAPFAARLGRAVAYASAGIESLRASVGAAVFPDDGRDAAQLIHVADQRLLAVKRDRPTTRVARRRAA